MCGIAGILDWVRPPSRALLQRMTDEMARRGPDAEGHYHNNFVALGHRRLSIIDLSEAATQPLFDTTRQTCIVFNGEIYNYLELRHELEKDGYGFATASDTEVILAAYQVWGTDCLLRFNGMFAFALWDEPRKRLFVARDRLGKKPFYYRLLPEGGIVFASELKAILQDPTIPRNLDPEAVSQFLSLGYTMAPKSIIAGIHKLEPASAMMLAKGRTPEQWCYWDLSQSFQKKCVLDEEEAIAEFTRLFDDATKLRMISDVPLGAFLSGGIDSSTIVASMCHQTSPTLVKTFSTGFNEKGFSELPDARLIAANLGVSHSEKVVDPQMASMLPIISALADEPFADDSMIPMFFLSEFARQQVTVALSGDGGDELFAGYETYAADMLHKRLSFIPAGILRGIQKTYSSLIPSSHGKVSLDMKIRRFLRGASLPYERAHFTWREFLSPAEKAALLRGPLRDQVLQADPFNSFQRYFDELPDGEYLDRSMYVDIKTWLANDILVKADRMSMAHSLELRCPFLDYRVVEFAASLPVSLKYRGGVKKYLLKRSQTQRLPQAVLNKSKKGFNAPASHWLRGDLGQTIVSPFQPNKPAAEIFNSPQVNALLDDHLRFRNNHSFNLLALYSLGRWINEYLGGEKASLPERPSTTTATLLAGHG